MSFKCVPQATGLTMGDPKPNKKTGRAPRHRHNGFGWLMECLEERATVSATVDRTLTYTNDYHGGPRSARKFWAEFENEIATEHQTVIHRKDGSTVTRAFRKDGVPLVGVIDNPPDEVWSEWDEDTRKKFIEDSIDVREMFEPRLFSRSHIRVHVTHNDEGGDDHILYDTFDDDGKCWGHLLDAKLLHDLCEYYPQAMRERGWDLEDLDVTDWERMKTDAEYAAERREKLRQGRLNTNAYIRKQNQAAAKSAAEARLAAEESAAEALRRELESTERAVKQDARTAKAKDEQRDAEVARDSAKEELARTKKSLAVEQQRVDAALVSLDALNGLRYRSSDGETHLGRRGLQKELARLEDQRKQAEQMVNAAQNYAIAVAAAAEFNASIPSCEELEFDQTVEYAEVELDERSREVDERCAEVDERVHAVGEREVKAEFRERRAALHMKESHARFVKGFLVSFARVLDNAFPFVGVGRWVREHGVSWVDEYIAQETSEPSPEKVERYKAVKASRMSRDSSSKKSAIPDALAQKKRVDGYGFGK